MILRETAIAMQFNEIAEGELKVIQRERPRSMSGDLHALPGSETGINRALGFLDLRFHPADLRIQVYIVLTAMAAEFVEFLLEFKNGFLEIQGLQFHRYHSSVTDVPRGSKIAISLMCAG